MNKEICHVWLRECIKNKLCLLKTNWVVEMTVLRATEMEVTKKILKKVRKFAIRKGRFFSDVRLGIYYVFLSDSWWGGGLHFCFCLYFT